MSEVGGSPVQPLLRVLKASVPIIGAPMWTATGAELASSVARSGGFGFIAAGFFKDGALLQREFQKAVQLNGGSKERLGLGLVSFTGGWLLDSAIALQPAAIWLAFGDFEQAAARVKQAGIPLVIMVRSVDEARKAAAVGADIVVAQGSESGGHGAGPTSTLCFVPEVIDALKAETSTGIPVLAAGGICDGRQVAAALTLGAAGVVVGTRLAATQESLLSHKKKLRYVSATSADFLRTRLYDDLGQIPWPAGVDGGAIGNKFTAAYGYAAPSEDARLIAAKKDLQQGVADEDLEVAPVWAGGGVAFVKNIDRADEVVLALWSDAKAALMAVSTVSSLSSAL